MRLSYLFDAAALVGAVLLLAGLWWIYPPLMLIVLGLVLAVGGFGGARVWAAIETGKAKSKAGRTSEPD